MSGAATEATPLLLEAASSSNLSQDSNAGGGWRSNLFRFLQGHTRAGRLYRQGMMALILVNLTVILAQSCFVDTGVDTEDDDEEDEEVVESSDDEISYRRMLQVLTNSKSGRMLLLSQSGSSGWSWWLLAWWFQLGVVIVYACDYLAHVIVADFQNEKYSGILGRLRYICFYFWSWVDLAAIVPFFFSWNSFSNLLPEAMQTTTWIRVLRLLLLFGGSSSGSDIGANTASVVGGDGQFHYLNALSILYQVFQSQQGILGTALFVGITTWMTVSALYYLAERRNLTMIYCPSCTETVSDPTATCTIDEWGLVNCTDCPYDTESSVDDLPPCYNLYESIPMASYYALLNLFGEFPLIDQHSVGGKFVGTLTAIVAVAVFALPAGILGNGFDEVLETRRQARAAAIAAAASERAAALAAKGEEDDNDDEPDEDEDLLGLGQARFYASDSARRGRIYNFVHANTTTMAVWTSHVINLLVLMTAFTYMLDTNAAFALAFPGAQDVMDVLEALAVVAFTIEYGLKVYSIAEDPQYSDGWAGRWRYMKRILPMVDFLSFVPFWIQFAFTGGVILTGGTLASTGNKAVQTLRLLRILRFERYTYAFTTFRVVLWRYADVLAVTAIVALVLWVLLGFALYYTELRNPDPEMASNYSSIPNAMWVTLLNLSGESPLCQYSIMGKVITGMLGLFATGLFGIPIGVLGNGFEEIVTERHADNLEELAAASQERAAETEEDDLGTPFERSLYRFVNGIGSTAGQVFEATIYFFIFLVVAVGIWQTVEGHQNDFYYVETVGVSVFTIEYLLRLVGAGADPEFREGSNGFVCRLRYLVSFYSIVDLLAIVPFFLAMALPNSIVDQYDEYLRMIRILRLVKLDKYIPSITLLDDVVRLKFNSLRVAFFAAMTLWVLFSALLFLSEHGDRWNEIDPVPQYGCDEDCTMLDRFQNYFDSMIYTAVHLTGDYPIITYSWPGRIVCFFMVISAVGVVSIPSGLIASGFVEIVQSKNRAQQGKAPRGRAGDDWYEHRYRELEGVDPPRSKFGPRMDAWQSAVNVFLNGTPGENGGHTQWTRFSYAGRVFIFTVIISNVIAVLTESVPRIDKAVGNESGNFFDVFEMFSVMVFALEYILRLFCAPKNREALYSSIIYATTFFGIVDLLSTAPWFVEQALIALHQLDAGGDAAKIFRMFRIFRILQLEDFVTAFSKLDNVFRASKDVLKATGLLAIIIWVGCGALFFIFEQNNPNWRSCDDSIPSRSEEPNTLPGCFDFDSTRACNAFYPGSCEQAAFTNMPNALFFTAVFLGGEWGVIDFTWPGRFVCLFLCVVGIALYAIPIGTLFDSFGAVLGLCEDEDCEDEECDDDCGDQEQIPATKG